MCSHSRLEITRISRLQKTRIEQTTTMTTTTTTTTMTTTTTTTTHPSPATEKVAITVSVYRIEILELASRPLGSCFVSIYCNYSRSCPSGSVSCLLLVLFCFVRSVLSFILFFLSFRCSVWFVSFRFKLTLHTSRPSGSGFLFASQSLLQ